MPLTSRTKTWHTPLFCSARLIFSERDENRDGDWTFLRLEIRVGLRLLESRDARNFCYLLPAAEDLKLGQTGQHSFSRNSEVALYILLSVILSSLGSQAASPVQQACSAAACMTIIKGEEENVRNLQMFIRSRIKTFLNFSEALLECNRGDNVWVSGQCRSSKPKVFYFKRLSLRIWHSLWMEWERVFWIMGFYFTRSTSSFFEESCSTSDNVWPSQPTVLNHFFCSKGHRKQFKHLWRTPYSQEAAAKCSIHFEEWTSPEKN